MGRRRKRRSGIAGVLLETGLFILAVLVLAFLLSRYVVERVEVHNHSMEHTLENNDSVLIDKISYRFRDPKRFDIIVFRQSGTGEELVKRVIGLPGETVQITDGVIYIDGEDISDTEGLDAPEYAGLAASPVKLSSGEYFVLGDNRKESIDSRYEEVGTVASTRITGRVFIRLLPVARMKLF
ncbi:MAG: signal peptidase I [Lachnospiraceae bacterium]|nr:signal peptidase I [Lachnospiraceae bacterium]